MHANRVLKWVEALESGKYRQATGQLATKSNETRYCCLGVACEVAIENGLEVDKTEDAIFDEITYDGDYAELPTSVENWFAINQDEAISLPQDLADVVTERINESADYLERDYVERDSAGFAEMNDSFGLTFEEIARAIRFHYKL